jgi:hypothetical protein
LGDNVLKIISPLGHFSTFVSTQQQYPFIDANEINKVKEEVLESELDSETKGSVLCSLEEGKVALLSKDGYVLFNGLAEEGLNDFRRLISKYDGRGKKKVKCVEAPQIQEEERRVEMFSMEECFSKLISFASTLNSAIERRENLKEEILLKITQVEQLYQEVIELKEVYEKIAQDVEQLQQKYEDGGIREQIEKLFHTNSFSYLSNLIQIEGEQKND